MHPVAPGPIDLAPLRDTSCYARYDIPRRWGKTDRPAPRPEVSGPQPNFGLGVPTRGSPTEQIRASIMPAVLSLLGPIGVERPRVPCSAAFAGSQPICGSLENARIAISEARITRRRGSRPTCGQAHEATCSATTNPGTRRDPGALSVSVESNRGSRSLFGRIFASASLENARATTRPTAGLARQRPNWFYRDRPPEKPSGGAAGVACRRHRRCASRSTARAVEGAWIHRPDVRRHTGALTGTRAASPGCATCLTGAPHVTLPLLAAA